MRIQMMLLVLGLLVAQVPAQEKNPAGENPLKLSGQIRVRGEAWENYAFGKANDDEFWLGRIRLGADYKLRPLRLYAEGISAWAFGRDLPPAGGKRPIDEDRLDLLNAYGDLSFELRQVKHTLRVGRQELEFGKQRLVSSLDWANTRRTFEGARLISEEGPWRVDTFATRLVKVDARHFNDGDSGQDFYGVYAALKRGQGGFDFYGLAQDRDAARFAASTNALQEDRVTLGARWFTPADRTAIDADLEAAYQFGEFGDRDVNAYMLAAEVGYLLSTSPTKPRLFAGLDYASGDNDPTDDTLTTFNQLYPLGHAYFGGIDMVGRQNIIDLSAGFSVTLQKAFTPKIEFHHFTKAEKADALYDAGGSMVAAGSAPDSDIGQEIDLTLAYKYDEQTKAMISYGHFFAGDAITTGEDIDVVYAQATYDF